MAQHRYGRQPPVTAFRRGNTTTRRDCVSSTASGAFVDKRLPCEVTRTAQPCHAAAWAAWVGE